MENQEYYEQHPIPQQISSYQFRLVGDMTLKQFFQVAGGALISIVIYSSGLPVIIKWPLVLVSFLLGLGLAFFPIQDRPLEKWIVSFFRSIYSPTIFRWKSTGKPYVFYQSESTTLLGSMAAKQSDSPGVPIPQQPPVDKQQAEILSAQIQLENKERDFFSKISGFLRGDEPNAQSQSSPTPTVVPISIQQDQTPPNTSLPSKYGFMESPQQVSGFAQNIPITTSQNVTESVTATPGQQTTSTQQAQFSSEAAPPSPPTIANVPVGQVLTNDGKIVEGAILEIRDADGRPARAVKTNKLGHFSIVTPLISGDYQIITEKDGYEFETSTLSANGEIIPPIVVIGKIVSTEPTKTP